MTAQADWHIVTPEYPPQCGGVSDYTRLVAEGLAAEGERVHVWCPGMGRPEFGRGSVTVHRALGKFSPDDLRAADRALDEFPGPRRLLVQWVPHGYGYRSMNLPFCTWIWKRARRGDIVEVMVHEPFLAFGEGAWRQDAAAVVHRLMTVILLRAASRIWVSIPAWKSRLRPFLLGRSVPMDWLPVPSNVECMPPDHFSSREERLTIGHFSTFGRHISEILAPLLRSLLAGCSDRCALLMGRGSREFKNQFIYHNPALGNQVDATGELPAADLSRRLTDCAVMIQPYPDGVSSRRGTAMAAISHGKPVVTTEGFLTEHFWRRSGAVALARVGDLPRFVELTEQLLESPEDRRRLGHKASVFYREHFDIRRTIATLQSRRDLNSELVS